MHIAMPVRLGYDLEGLFVPSNSRIVVDQRWNIFLLDDINVSFLQTEVIISLKQCHRSIMRIIRNHYAKWDVETGLFLCWHHF